jgi:hypothetical protein
MLVSAGTMGTPPETAIRDNWFSRNVILLDWRDDGCIALAQSQVDF